MNTVVKSALKLPETCHFHIDTKPNDEYLYEQTMKPVTKKGIRNIIISKIKMNV